jgi:hypothetical protein
MRGLPAALNSKINKYHYIGNTYSMKFLDPTLRGRSRDRVVDIATGYGLDEPSGRSSNSGGDKSRPAMRFTQPIQWLPGSLSPGVERPGREADH